MMDQPEDQSPHQHDSNEDLFDSIRQFLWEQTGEDIYEELSRTYQMAASFAERELEGRVEYARMLRGIERLVDDIFGGEITRDMRSRVAEVLYLYGLAHYSILQQISEASGDEEGGVPDDLDTNRPLIVHDVWFPNNIGIEHGPDNYYLHIGDGRIDLSIYMGTSPNERGILVDFVDHWEYAVSNTHTTIDMVPDLSTTVPLMAVEMDYAGSELVDADDHVDILLFDHRGEPFVRIHLRDSDLRAIVDEIQEIDSSDNL